MSAAKTPPQNPVKPADRAQFHACLGRWQERLALAAGKP